jgi:hypothetical protein
METKNDFTFFYGRGSPFYRQMLLESAAAIRRLYCFAACSGAFGNFEPAFAICWDCQGAWN